MPRHFSMLRDFRLADAFTLGNGFCGMGSILSTLDWLAGGLDSSLWRAFALLPLALVLDVLDGRVARWRAGKASFLGQDLDSLADLVSFGVAPAVLGFALGLRGGWDAAILIYFVGCGIARLARFNATAAELADESGKVKYFEGTPIPTSLLLVAILALLAWSGRVGDGLPFGAVELGFTLHPLALIYAASGSAMISKTLRVPKL